jgi:nicotinamide mononucleotide adenylyltransferase
MNAPQVGTVIKKRSFKYIPREREINHWDFLYLTNRRKIKKKKGIDYEYQAIIYEWKYDGYIIENKTISLHTIRSLFQHKTQNSITKINPGELDAYIAKQLLLG